MTWFHFRLMKTFFFPRPSTSWPFVYKSQESKWPSIMSESDTMFNERDRRCAAVQLMFSTVPSYENRTIASTFKMQIWIVTNNRDMQRWWKQSFRQRLSSLVWFQVRAKSCHLAYPKSAWKSTTKCTWMCWRVWWSPSGGRWQTLDVAAGLGAGPQVQRDPGFASKGVLQLCTLLSLAPSCPDLNPLGYFVSSYVENITNMTSHNTKVNLIAAIRRVFAELPPALVKKASSHFRIRIEAVIDAESSYIKLMSALLHNQVTWIDFFNKSSKIKL